MYLQSQFNAFLLNTSIIYSNKLCLLGANYDFIIRFKETKRPYRVVELCHFVGENPEASSILALPVPSSQSQWVFLNGILVKSLK